MAQVATLRRVDRYPQWALATLAVLSRLIPWALLRLLSSLPAFDSSAQLLSGRESSTSLRWDAIHFASIAKDGYRYEQHIAFQPGWPLLLRALSSVISGQTTGADEVGRIAQMGELLACGSYVGATIMLYRLTCRISTPPFALTASLLYLLPPAPGVLSSSMSEPLFALLTFTGFYLAVRRRFWLSAQVLAGATSVRATGVLAVGPVAWIMMFGEEPILRTLRRPVRLARRCISCIPPVAIIIAPFVTSQTYFYYALCQGGEREEWCSNALPLAYSHVQEKYWNVGMLNYWSPAQIPNILLALPVLLVSLLGSYHFFLSYIAGSTGTSPLKGHGPRSLVPYVSTANRQTNLHILLPFYIHSLALTLLLLFSAHTQIALRVCVTDPVIWWSLAGLAFRWKGSSRSFGAASTDTEGKEDDMTRMGKVWVWWTIIYGAISTVLWAGHYPPA